MKEIMDLGENLETEKRFEEYPTYKVSKIRWLSYIPHHWGETKLRFIGKLYGGLSGKTANDFNQYESEDNKEFIPFKNIADNLTINADDLNKVVVNEGEKQNEVKKGDIFFLMTSETFEDVGKTAVLENNMNKTYLNSFCKGFRIIDGGISSRFLNYQLNCKPIRDNLLNEANGFIRVNLRIDKVKDLLVAIPPLKEQKAIADFLDDRTRKIDELIEAKQKLLDLLEEKRRALITQAVTKGLDPDVKMKDSGVEWLGKVPEHWEVLPVRRYAKRVQTGSTPPTKEVKYYENGSIPWYGPGSIGQEIAPLEPVKWISEVALQDGVARLFDADSVFVVAIGATIGKVAWLPKKASTNQQITSISFESDKVIGKYAAYQLKIIEEVLRSIAPSATLPILDQGEVASLPIAIPSKKEQEGILEYLENELERIDEISTETKEALEMLKEYRSSLISSVVTGRIACKEAADGLSAPYPP